MEASAEERIIHATISCIESEGLERATIRKIAETAGVNSAAINYYFRSKDALLETALNRSLENAFDWEDFGSSQDASPAERLSQIMSQLMVGASTYPNLSRAHLDDRPGARKVRRTAIASLEQFLTTLEEDLAERDPSVKRSRLRATILQAFNATVVGIIFTPELFEQHAGIDVDDDEARLEYVRSLVYPLLRE